SNFQPSPSYARERVIVPRRPKNYNGRLINLFERAFARPNCHPAHDPTILSPPPLCCPAPLRRPCRRNKKRCPSGDGQLLQGHPPPVSGEVPGLPSACQVEVGLHHDRGRRAH